MSVNLNAEQKKAVYHKQGPLLIIAGAGSGKTKVIIEKIIYLVNTVKIPAHNIYAISFTNKAGQELRQRANQILGKTAKNLQISTFHALGIKILRQEHDAIGYKKNFSIIDNEDRKQVIAEIIGNHDNSIINNASNKISEWKNNYINIDCLETDSNDEKEYFTIYKKYRERLKSYQTMDFDDLLLLPVSLFINNPLIQTKWQQKIQYLLVDEYQDTNSIQYYLLKLLRISCPNFTVVGDDDQSIYSFRGANSDNFNILRQDFSDLEIIKFEQNYRSTNAILTTANKLILNNNKSFNKKLWSNLGIGKDIPILATKNEEELVNTLLRKIIIHHQQHNSSYSDYAILYRSNHQSKIIELALQSKNIAYNIAGGVSFFSASEIKDIIAYLRLIVNYNDDIALLRIINTPKRTIGVNTIKKLVDYAESRNISLFNAIDEIGFANICPSQQLTILINFQQFIITLNQYQTNIAEMMQYLLSGIDYEFYLHQSFDKADKKWNNVVNFSNWLIKKNTNNSLATIIQNLMLLTIINNNETVAGINLSTIHAAKGLEYKYVYIIDCEEEILPHKEAIEASINGNQSAIAEERRLMYVAITRAKYELSILYCLNRKKQGELIITTPSRFVQEMDNPHIKNQTKIQNQIITDQNTINNNFFLLKNRLGK